MISEEAAKALRAPFPDSQIGKLPRKGTNGLDFVGHAAVTDRLLAVDPEWTWEPVAFAEDGAPLVRYDATNASLWIRMTVCGVTRLGVGIVELDKFELEKQLISDALRNAAMRFGVALDLWSKQDLWETSQPANVDIATGEIRTETTRRQPSPMPGFETLEEQRAAHAEYETLAATQSDAVKESLKRWRADEKLPYPMSRQDLGRAMTILKASGMGGSRTPGDDEGSGSPLVTAPSIPVSEPADVAQQALTSEGTAGVGGQNVSGDAGLREDSGAVDGASSSPDTTPPGAVPIPDSGKGYEAWKRRDLIIECAERDPVIDTLSNATITTLVEQLRAWDRLHNPGAVEWSERPF